MINVFRIILPLETGFEINNFIVISEQDIFGDRLINSGRKRRTKKFLSKNEKLKYLSYGDHPGNHFEMLMPITIDDITNKKIIIIHRYDLPSNFLKENLLVKQMYEMPNSKNNFYISYFE